jgi:cytochrome c2
VEVDVSPSQGIKAAATALALLVASTSPAAGEPAWSVAGADPGRGAHLIAHLGCGGCHVVPGVRGAVGDVGPPLERFGERGYIAGMLRNTPSNLVRWLRDPQGVVPGNAMPNMDITEDDARDIASYLYTLR